MLLLDRGVSADRDRLVREYATWMSGLNTRADPDSLDQTERMVPPLEATKTIFNDVATYNGFERRFAEFLDKKAKDVLRFASLGTTEQGESGSQFRVDYLKPSGAIGFYHPDWVVVQKTTDGEVNWIIETKGRVWEGTAAKDEALQTWCARVSAVTGRKWQYARINQKDFDSKPAVALRDLVKGLPGLDGLEV